MNRVVLYAVGLVAVIGVVAVTRWSKERPLLDLWTEARREQAEFEAQTKAATKLELENLYGHPCLIGVTIQAYDLLKPGMAEYDARNIIGDKGVQQSSAGNIVTKRWQNNGKAIVLTFQDGRLVGKSQVGL